MWIKNVLCLVVPTLAIGISRALFLWEDVHISRNWAWQIGALIFLFVFCWAPLQMHYSTREVMGTVGPEHTTAWCQLIGWIVGYVLSLAIVIASMVEEINSLWKD